MANLLGNHRQPHKRLKGLVTMAGGLLLLFSFMAVAAYLGVLPGVGGLANVPWALFIGLSIGLVIRGRRMMAVDAVSLLEHDKRPPIIYLRPFAADKRLPPQRGLALLRSKQKIKLQGWTPATYEEQITRALKMVGPVVAIGSPNERLPELGAARMYVDNSNWQEKVKELIAKAGLIFIQTGESESLLWELNQVVETVEPQQVIMGLPVAGKGGEKARQAQYDRFRMQCVSALPKSLPEEIGHAQFLYFGEGWSPQLFTPHKSVQLPQPSLTERAELPLQLQALKRLQAEFMLVSTPYWVRFCGLMTGIMILWIFIVFMGLRLLSHSR